MAEQELADLKLANAQLLIEVQQDKLNSEQKIQQLQERIIQEQATTLTRLQKNIAPKRLPMNNSQPQYNGLKTENIMDWINITSTNLQNAHIPNIEWVSIASSYLRTNALQHYNAIRADNPDWNQFIDSLKEEFLPPNYNIIIYDELRKLNCKSEISDYIAKFNYLLNQVQITPDLVKILIFRDGCQEDTKHHLAYKNPQTLKEAQQLAIAYETHLKKKSYDPTISTYTTIQNKYKTGKYCFNCKRNNHSTEECFKNKKQKTQTTSQQQQ